MVLNKEEQQIYIVISQTGTVLSRLLRRITGADYNHVSLGFSKELESMYSFGRLNAYNPFYGGFVIESRNHGTFKRFKNTEAIILALDIGADKKEQIVSFVDNMVLQRKKYHYNYFGLVLASVHIAVRLHNRYYCSEFVRDLLQRFDIEGSKDMAEIVQPIHFLDMPFTDIIYKGRLHDYSVEKLNNKI